MPMNGPNVSCINVPILNLMKQILMFLMSIWIQYHAYLLCSTPYREMEIRSPNVSYKSLAASSVNLHIENEVTEVALLCSELELLSILLCWSGTILQGTIPSYEICRQHFHCSRCIILNTHLIKCTFSILHCITTFAAIIITSICDA
jgi:hypothetical protein